MKINLSHSNTIYNQCCCFFYILEFHAYPIMHDNIVFSTSLIFSTKGSISYSVALHFNFSLKIKWPTVVCISSFFESVIYAHKFIIQLLSYVHKTFIRFLKKNSTKLSLSPSFPLLFSFGKQHYEIGFIHSKYKLV